MSECAYECGFEWDADPSSDCAESWDNPEKFGPIPKHICWKPVGEHGVHRGPHECGHCSTMQNGEAQ